LDKGEAYYKSKWSGGHQESKSRGDGKTMETIVTAWISFVVGYLIGMIVCYKMEGKIHNEVKRNRKD